MKMPDKYFRKLYELKESYVLALNEKSFENAVVYGEAYYRTLRNGDLTTEDREKMQNEILQMNMIEEDGKFQSVSIPN